MASPQKENGFTSISNELVDAMAKHDFGYSKGQVFMSIIRLTYGWHKKEDKISISRICEITKLSKRTVIYTLQNLEAQKKLIITRSIKNGLKDINNISIQKDYELWNDDSFALQYMRLKEKSRSSAKLKRSSAKLKRSSAKPRKLVVQNLVNDVNSFAHTKETITKDNIKETINREKTPVKKDFRDPEIQEGIETLRKDQGHVAKETLNRYSLKRLYRTYGKEQTLRVFAYAVKIRGKSYAPQILNFMDLEEKWGKIEEYGKREKKALQAGYVDKPFIPKEAI